MLVTTLDQFRSHVRVSTGMRFEQLNPFVRQAEQQYLLPVLGPAFLEALQTHVDDSGTSAALDEVLEEAQRTESLFAMFLAIPVLQLKMEDTGLHALSNEQYKSPYQWQVGDYREGYMLAAYAAVEALYTVLMKHRDDSALAAWKTSDGYASYSDTLLRNAKEFSSVMSIGYSHITYVDLKPAIQRAEDLVIRQRIGDAFYDQLVAHVNDEDSSESDPTDSDLLDIAVKKLRPALAQLTVAHATEVLFKTVNGALLSSRYDGNSSTDVKVIDDRLHNAFAATTRSTAMNMGMQLLAAAQGWMDRNAADLPLYRTGPGFRPDGNDERPIEERIHNAGGMMMV